jgi:hypothetical protein
MKKIKKSLKELENKFKSPFNCISYIIVIIIILFLAIYFSYKKVDDYVLSSISYVENSVVDYRVYYLDNPFYSEKFISSGKTYIAQYVNYIDIDFNYLVNYLDSLSGNYEYYVKAKLIAYTPGDESDDLWTKNYNLSSTENEVFNDLNNYSISKNIKINYQEYLSEYNKYRASSAVASSCNLVVELVIKNNSKYSGVDDIEFNRIIKVNIPISDPTFKITYKDNLSSNMQTVKSISSINITKIIYRVIGALLWIIEILLLLILLYLYRSYLKRVNLYDKTLKRILNTYDGIIVNVERLPELYNTNIVYVTSFEELVDDQN